MNKSHPKKDLLNFINIYQIPIEEPNDIPKLLLGVKIFNYKFKSYDDLYNLAAKISLHCDIPTCRRAITEFNMDSKLRNKFEIKLSAKCKKDLDQKNINKAELMSNFRYKKGLYKLSFD
jgi:hypothetical protein